MKNFFLALSLFFFSYSLEAGYSPYFKEWTTRYAPEYSAYEHYDYGYQLFVNKNWKGALPHFLSIVHHFEDSDFYTNALYYTAVCYYFDEQLDIANRYFSEYLSSPGNLKHYERALEFKFYIAECYAGGRKKRLFSMKMMPAVVRSLDEAVRIYDEVIAALANKELAVQALYSKSAILHKQRKYDESIEVLKTLVHRYEVHELAEMAFVKIAEIYVDRAYQESQDPDLLALAELNLRAFRSHFPSSPKIQEVETSLALMQEIFATSLLETAHFYQRKSKPAAAQIYLQELVSKFPNTESAQKGRTKMMQ